MLNLGFIGLGVMGQPMALNLRKAGHALSVYARNPAQSEPLRAAGAAVLATPNAVAQAVDILFINVSNDTALEAVLYGANGAASGLTAGNLVVDMGTTSPELTRTLAARLAESGISLVDAPVSGGQTGAIAGTLSIMVGGPTAAFQRLLSLFQAIGSNIVHVGDCGAGQIAKACNQIVVSATLLGVAEALTFATRHSVDAAKVRQALLGGSAYSKILENHGQRMLDENYIPGFKTRLHRKDLGIVLATAQTAGLALPATALVAQLMNALAGNGQDELDSSALIAVIKQLNKVTP